MKVELDKKNKRVPLGSLCQAETFQTDRGTAAIVVYGERVTRLGAPGEGRNVAVVDLRTGDVFRMKNDAMVTLCPMKVVRDD